MNKGRMLVMMLGLLIVALLLAACGPAASDESEIPTGKFLRSGSEIYGIELIDDENFRVFTTLNSTIVRGVDGSLLDPLPGEITNPDRTVVRGTYRIDGDLFIEESNDGGCLSPMRFKYTFDGSNLNFQYVTDPSEDACDGRRGDFNDKTYVYVN